MKYSNKINQRISGRHYACAEAVDYKNKKILNIGCNNGIFEFLIFKKAKEIVGVDIKDEDLAQAKKECAGIQNVNFVKANIVEDNFPLSSADIVVFSDVIEHIPKGTELKVLKKIHNILKPNGQVIISTPLDNKTKYLDLAWYLYPRHRHYTKEKMVELLVEAGFEIKDIYTRGGFYEMVSMIFFYPFRHILNLEIPFKNWWDRKRKKEYKKDDGCVTLFVVATKKSLAPY